MRRTALHWLVACVLTASGFGASLEELEQSYLVRYDQTIGRRDLQLEKLRDSYLDALGVEMEKAKKSGKLEMVIPFRDEIDVVKAQKDPLPALPERAVYQLTAMRGKYVGARRAILKTHATELSSLADKMENLLKLKEAELTKAGEIDEGLAAKLLRETLSSDDEIRAARDLLNFSGGNGPGPVAVRLRRYGDDIEVLVRYDDKGGISMKSPIENVREDGGGKLDTTATVLGEFVGADDNQADPYVAFAAALDDRDLSGMAIGEIEAKPNFAIDGRKGVRLSLAKNAANPHISFGALLPPLSKKGSYRIRFSYFVPESNQVVAGIKWVHGVGGLIGGQAYEERGQWTDAVASGESAINHDRLILYFHLKEGKKFADAGDEFLVLSGVKVEHLKFSAFLCARHGEDGEVTEEFETKEQQPLFISNGVMVKD